MKNQRTAEQASAARPTSLDVVHQEECHNCVKYERINTALAVVSMFLDHTKVMHFPTNGTDEVISVRGELTPREEATYIAALDKLEKFVDAVD